MSVGAIFERYGPTLATARHVLDELLRAPLPEPGAERAARHRPVRCRLRMAHSMTNSASGSGCSGAWGW